jgi:hypothetical protein
MSLKEKKKRKGEVAVLFVYSKLPGQVQTKELLARSLQILLLPAPGKGTRLEIGTDWSPSILFIIIMAVVFLVY